MMNEPHEYRVCPRCDRELPLTEEWWYQGTIDALIEYPDWSKFPRYCKECAKQTAHERYHHDPDTKKRILKQQREYQQRPEIRERRNEQRRVRRQRFGRRDRGGSYSSEYGLEYRNRPEVKARRKAVFKVYREANREKINLKNLLGYHRKQGNTARVIELEAELSKLNEV